MTVCPAKNCYKKSHPLLIKYVSELNIYNHGLDQCTLTTELRDYDMYVCRVLLKTREYTFHVFFGTFPVMLIFWI